MLATLMIQVALLHAYVAFTLFLSLATCSKPRKNTRKEGGVTSRSHLLTPQRPKNKQSLKEAKTQQASTPMKSDGAEQGAQTKKVQGKSKKDAKEVKPVQSRKEKMKSPAISMNEGTPIDAHQLELLNAAQNMERTKSGDYVNPDLCFDDVFSEKSNKAH